MTEDQNAPTGRPHGGIELPLPGKTEGRAYEDAVEHETVADIDYEDNELHAVGRTCARCGRAIQPEEDVRRTASGAYEHEFCEVSADPGPVATGG